MSMVGRPKRITGTGDDGLVVAGPATLFTVVVGVDSAGVTLALHDCATEGAAGAGNRVGTIELDTRGAFEYGPGARFEAGLVVIASGSCDVTVVWG